MWRFIISILFVASPLLVRAQLFKPLEVGRSPFVRISVDPTLPLKSFLQEADIYGFEGTIDSEIKQNLFLMGGLGFSNTAIAEGTYDYTSSGMFGMIGADLNLTKYQNPKDRNIFFMGLHYGFAVLSHEATGVSISNYWGDYNTQVSSESHTASWLEISMGTKAEAAKNIFIGWTADAKFRTHLSDGDMKPYYVPGLGKTDSNFSFDISFFVSYAITMKPKKQKPEVDDLD